jgi:hypothetical protein
MGRRRALLSVRRREPRGRLSLAPVDEGGREIAPDDPAPGNVTEIPGQDFGEAPPRRQKQALQVGEGNELPFRAHHRNHLVEDRDLERLGEGSPGEAAHDTVHVGNPEPPADGTDVGHRIFDQDYIGMPLPEDLRQAAVELDRDKFRPIRHPIQDVFREYTRAGPILKDGFRPGQVDPFDHRPGQVLRTGCDRSCFGRVKKKLAQKPADVLPCGHNINSHRTCSAQGCLNADLYYTSGHSANQSGAWDLRKILAAHVMDENKILCNWAAISENRIA